MALASLIMLRRASSSLLLPRSLLAVRSSSAALLAVDRSLVVPLFRRFSSSSSSAVSSQTANKDSVRMLDVEIKRADKNLNTCVVPPEFPFKIKKTKSENKVFLSRRYEDEIIHASVKMSGSDGEGNYSDLSMVVTISEESRNDELIVDMEASRDRIDISSTYARFHDYRDADRFDELDQDELEKVLYEFLEMRGINLTTTNFLLEKKMKMAPLDSHQSSK